MPDIITDEEIILSEDANKFSGRFSLSFNGLLFYAIIIILLWLLGKGKGSYSDIGGAALFITALYFSFGDQSYYFFVTGKHLLIKNQLFPWYRRIYVLDEIKETAIKTDQKLSNALQVITTDDRSRSFHAGSIRHKTWDALAKKLQQQGIPVQYKSLTQ